MNKPFTVRLYDATGRVVYSQQFQATTNNRVTIATDNLPSAIYTATIDMEGVIANKKVTIMK
jgi:hypothetical protein